MAAAAAAGAVAAWAVPWPLVAIVVAAALLTWRPTVLVVAAFVICAVLGARAEAGLEPPSRASVTGWATLISDPRQAMGGAWRVDVDLDGRRLQAWARGSAAAALRDRLAGEVVFVEGSVSALEPRSGARLRWRHIAGRLTIDRVSDHRRGALHARLANGVRRTLTGGAEPLGDDHRALLAGFVLGDDRDQSDALADDFRGSGLSHLLAVSGQNVAFVLLLAGPLLRRLRPRGRLVAVVVLLGLFGTVTRWEPSVIRAVAMASVGVWAAHRGTPASSRRTLALAVTGLLVIDPLLVHSVGFVLSAGACAGITTLAAPLSRWLPGPAWLRLPVAVTLAAQAGVSPVLIPVFGGVPLASLPANLLAAPAAGPVMVWGLSAGLVAGVLGPPLDVALHGPTVALISWVRWVAAVGARLPLGELGASHAVALSALAAVGWHWRRLARPALVLAAVVALMPALSMVRGSGSHIDGDELARGAWLWRRGGATLLLVDGAPHAPSLLEGLRQSRVTRLDVVVLSGRSSLGTLDVLRGRVVVRRIAAPADAEITGAAPLEAGDEVRAGRLQLAVAEVAPRVLLTAPTRGGPEEGQRDGHREQQR